MAHTAQARYLSTLTYGSVHGFGGGTEAAAKLAIGVCSMPTDGNESTVKLYIYTKIDFAENYDWTPTQKNRAVERV